MNDKSWHAFLTAIILCLSVLGSPPASADDCDVSMLPQAVPPPAGTGEASCEYEQVPFATVSYQNGYFSATWSDDYDIEAAYLAADFELIGTYTPGFAVNLAQEAKKSRFDVLLRVHDDVTQEEFLAISRIWCRVDGAMVNAWESDCEPVVPLGCSITSKETCDDGTVISVTCTGDKGTCSDSCSDIGSACCTGSSTVTWVDGAGVVHVRVTLDTATATCPPSN